MSLHQINSFYEIGTERGWQRMRVEGGLWDPRGGHCGEALREAGAHCSPGTLEAWAVRWPWISVLEPFSGLWAGLTPLMKHKEQTCLTPSYFVMTCTHVNIKVQILNCARGIWCLCKVWKISIFREKLRNQEVDFSQDPEIPSQKYICSFRLLLSPQVDHLGLPASIGQGIVTANCSALHQHWPLQFFGRWWQKWN